MAVSALEVRLPPLPLASREGRHALAAWLGPLALGTQPGQDALVVVSELVTNGVVHDGGDDIVVRADRVDGGVQIQVVTTPRLPGTPPYPRPNLDPDEIGRGMALVAAMCQDVRVHNEADGRRVVDCRLDLAADVRLP